MVGTLIKQRIIFGNFIHELMGAINNATDCLGE